MDSWVCMCVVLVVGETRKNIWRAAYVGRQLCEYVILEDTLNGLAWKT